MGVPKNFTHTNLEDAVFLVFSRPSGYFIFPQGFLSCEFRETSHLELRVSNSLTFCIMCGCESPYVFEKALLMVTEQGTDLSTASSMSLGVLLELHCNTLPSSIWFYPRFLSYLVSGSWSYKQC